VTVPVVAPIVEGHGEVPALPVLLRRISGELGWPMRIAQPYRAPRAKIASPAQLAALVGSVSAGAAGGGGVLVLLDADDDCPVELRRSLDEAARGSFANTEVVLANREFEAWFLASMPTLRSHPTVRSDPVFAADPDQPRGAKERLEKLMTERYRETVHQAKFCNLIDLEMTWRNSRSFRRLVSALQRLLEVESPPWTL
jgi:hypothetical protein